MDRFEHFAPPSPGQTKKSFFARLFGLGKEEKKPTTPVTSSSSGQRFPSPGQAKSSNNTASTQLVKPTQPQQVSTNKSSQPSQATDAVEPVIEFPSSLDQIKRRKFDNKHKQFWMVDESVPMCYECDTPFTVINRRHHCRACGQIFCAKCTQITAEGEIPGYSGSIRVCNFCYNILLQNTDISETITEIIDHGVPTPRGKRYDDEHDTQEEELFSKTLNRVSFLTPIKEPAASAEDNFQRTLSSSNLSTNLVRSDSGNLTNKVDDATTIIGEANSPDAREPDSIEEFFDEIIHEGDNVDSFASAPTSPIAEDDSVDAITFRRKQTRKAFSVDLGTLPKPALNPANRKSTSDELEEEEHPANKSILLRQVKAHMTKLCSLLIKHYELHESWQGIILSLARQVTDNLKIQIQAGDKMDIRNYIKVKKIPGGSMQNCEYIDGIVITKNRTHKRMSSEMAYPKVLLLGCALEFERTQQRLVSFSKLLSQEREYLKLMVSKIAAVKPDIIFVEKNVSRIAQEYLLEAGICLFHNVKPNVMQILSRLTQRPILQSVEHVLTADMGYVGHYKVEQFTGPWGKKSCTFITGCPRSQFATLVIRGAPDPILSKVKSVLLFICNAYWNSKLELSVLLDECGTSIRAQEENISLQVGANEVISAGWTIEVPPELAKARLRRKKAQDQVAAENEDEDYSICPTLQSVPKRPELLLSCTTGKVLDPEERTAQLSLSFSYRTLLNPQPKPTVEEGANSSVTTAQFQEKKRKHYEGILHPQLTDPYFVYLHAQFCNTTSSQCTPFEWQIIHYYSSNDLTLGQFLETFCFSSKVHCSVPGCSRPMTEHERCFMHYRGRLNIAVRPWPQNMLSSLLPQNDNKHIYMWAYCKQFNRQTPYMAPMSADTWNFSFGRYLELIFYGNNAVCRTCHRPLYRDHIRYFYYDNKVAIFEYEPIIPMELVVPAMKMKLNRDDQIAIMEQELEDVIFLSQRIHERVLAKLNELDDMCGPQDVEERTEIAEYRKLQEKEKLHFLEKIRVLQDNIAKGDCTLFVIYELRRALYANVKTWNSTIVEHELRFQKPLHRATLKKSDFEVRNEAAPSPKQSASISAPPSLDHSSYPTSLKISVEVPVTASESLFSSTISNSGEIAAPTSVNFSNGTEVSHMQEHDNKGATIQAPAYIPIVEAPRKQPPESLNATSNPISVPTPPTSEGSSSSSGSSNNSPCVTTEVKADPLNAHLLPSAPASMSHQPRSGYSSNKSIFNAFSHILPTSSKSKIVDVMEDCKVHIFAGSSDRQVCVAVHENEPSSIISFALNSEEYQEAMRQLQETYPITDDPDSDTFMENAYNTIMSAQNTTISNEWREESVWGGPKIKLACTSHFAYQFLWLRKLLGLSEEDYSLSLAKCRIWKARGGKTNSRFAKTLDTRFILKSVQPVELQAFLAFAPLYFDYFSKVYFQQVPTAIAKIVGIYSVYIKTARKEEKRDFIIMENIFYGHKISRTLDLKGSQRSRYATPSGSDPESFVMLDENLLEIMYAEPICITREAKTLLGMTVWNDTLCLSSLDVMDYSLLVGIDEETNELVVGIIDYMRTYTWDKQLETWVKRSGILGGGLKEPPTIISPKQYKKRFRSAMWNYFLLLPDIATHVRQV